MGSEFFLGLEVGNMSQLTSSGKTQIPIKDGLFTTPLSPAGQAKLMGSRCKDCREISLGKRQTCSNCGGGNLEETPLGSRGKLWTYTVIRHKPPGNYKGPDPFVPFGLGLVELPEGIRVLSPLQCDLEKMKIGMELELEVYPLYTDENQNEVMAFRFRPVQEEGR
jgi:uncharacterized OB-fold protein